MVPGLLAIVITCGSWQPSVTFLSVPSHGVTIPAETRTEMASSLEEPPKVYFCLQKKTGMLRRSTVGEYPLRHSMVTGTGSKKVEPTQTPPFMVYSTVTRKYIVQTHPEEGGNQVSVSIHVVYLLDATPQGNRDFTQMSSTLHADSDSPRQCQPLP